MAEPPGVLALRPRLPWGRARGVLCGCAPSLPPTWLYLPGTPLYREIEVLSVPEGKGESRVLQMLRRFPHNEGCSQKLGPGLAPPARRGGSAGKASKGTQLNSRLGAAKSLADATN